MVSTLKKFYITTAIDYPNNRPHLGHAYEKIFADCIARWKRLRGFDVFFLTGTDEHGLKIQKAAEKAGKSPKRFVDEMVVHFLNLCKIFDISYDRFIRTTEKEHIKFVQSMFKKLLNNKEIFKGVYKGLYCTSCEAFYTEKDLVEENCPVHKRPVERISEESYFFSLSHYQKKVQDILNKGLVLPEERSHELRKRLEEKVHDLSISRKSVTWGIQLPNDPSHVIYVWLDALNNYISGLGSKQKKYWPADLHVIGPDIAWFHAVIWPALLYAEGFAQPKNIFVHGIIKSGGEKLSKTTGNVIDPILLAEKYGSDSLRYFLLRDIPAGSDGDFSEDSLVNRINGDLADNIGNLVSRVLTLIEKKFDGKIPRPTKNMDNEIEEFINHLALLPNNVAIELDSYKTHAALAQIITTVSRSNKFINDTEPWRIEDKEKLGDVLYALLEAIRFTAVLLEPFIPATSRKIFKQLGLKERFKFDDLKYGKLKPGTKIKKGEILFQKIKL